VGQKRFFLDETRYPGYAKRLSVIRTEFQYTFVLKAFSESCLEIQLYNIYYIDRYNIMYSDGFKSFWFVQIPAFGVKSTTMKRGRNIYNTVRNVI